MIITNRLCKYKCRFHKNAYVGVIVEDLDKDGYLLLNNNIEELSNSEVFIKYGEL